MALPKSYFKRFPGDLKAAWAAYRRDSGKSKSDSSAKKKTKSKGAAVATAKNKAKKAYSKAKKIASTKPVQLALQAGLATVGGVATSTILNKTPVIRDMDKGIKSGAQLVLGLGGIFFFKNRFLQSLSAGSLVAGVFGLSKNYLKLDPLASGGRRMTDAEVQQIQRMIPQLRNQSMGMPADVSGRNRGMGMPSEVLAGGSRGWSTSW